MERAKEGRMVSVVDVARHAGVSQATVSRVLSGKVFVAEDTRGRVIRSIEVLGYRPSSIGKALRSGQIASVAFLVSDIEQGWYSALAKQLQLALQAVDLDLLLFDLGHSQQRLTQALRHCQSLHVRALVLASSDPLDFVELRSEIANLRRGKMRLISTGQDLTAAGFMSIIHDEQDAGKRAIAHLVGRGCRRIAYLNRVSHSVAGQRRFQAYRRALGLHGLEFDEALVWSNPAFRFEGGFRSASDAIEKKIAFDAILAGTDELAAGALAAITDAGYRVPDDVALIGFGDLSLSRYTRPALSTLSGQAEEMCRIIVECLSHSDIEMLAISRDLILRESA
ncbi:MULTISPECIES: LacI family DNA-binding transcriptional regulator [unclassified Chelatococcus]|uniref:LacI family DNA-binding transcriptional regulator n=1 Tax=unclassified Chelatococcus TaxID=2638111 RepID=UPI001BD00810|nr:LacI family DNA-binding transcriptional regulator [Chelatococcus sp.]MBS7741179.1 LacI family DNA-binding transcriptional regulator [Chelatococcus sp. HY11]MBX3545365.1 LacI family DNA-binding transcriptional regulator [Chelatococcus sp.]MCO5078000.1 LacI family transcriptional regulator [Chelatococcus sp.]